MTITETTTDTDASRDIYASTRQRRFWMPYVSDFIKKRLKNAFQRISNFVMKRRKCKESVYIQNFYTRQIKTSKRTKSCNLDSINLSRTFNESKSILTQVFDEVVNFFFRNSEDVYYCVLLKDVDIVNDMGLRFCCTFIQDKQNRFTLKIRHCHRRMVQTEGFRPYIFLIVRKREEL